MAPPWVHQQKRTIPRQQIVLQFKVLRQKKKEKKRDTHNKTPAKRKLHSIFQLSATKFCPLISCSIFTVVLNFLSVLTFLQYSSLVVWTCGLAQETPKQLQIRKITRNLKERNEIKRQTQKKNIYKTVKHFENFLRKIQLRESSLPKKS